MAIQTFVADTILTAAQMNALQGNDYNQTVSTKTASYTLVAADKGTKIVMNSASATTITVNTSLFSAGDTLTILNIAAGVTTLTAGTATVSTTGSLALAQNGGGTLYFTSAGVSIFQANGVTASSGALVYVGGASPSAAATVSIDNVFSATYENYLIKYNLTFSASSGTRIQLRVGGVTTAGTGYNSSFFYSLMTSAATGNVVTGAAAHWLPSQSGQVSRGTIEIYQPFTAVQTSITFEGITEDGTYNMSGGGQHTGATSFDGLHFSLSTGTITGTIRIYGRSNS